MVSASLIASLSAGSIEEQLFAARKLKNELIGQDLRKEFAVRNGIIQPLANILVGTAKVSGKKRLETHGLSHWQTQEWMRDDDLALQAALIVLSLASAGLSFVRPLCAANVPQILVETLSFDISPKLITTILQGLKAITQSWALADSEASENPDLWPTIFNTTSVDVFDVLLRQRSGTLIAQTQIGCVADIISAVGENCPESVHDLLADSRLMDTFASLLAAHAIKAGHIRNAPAQSGAVYAPPSRLVPSILNAISAIVSNSTYRTYRFILSPMLRDLFAKQGQDGVDSYGPRQGFDNGHACLLPPLHIPQYRSITHLPPKSANFPALRVFQVKGSEFSASAFEAFSSGAIDHCNAVCSLLIIVARSISDMGRLAALKLLALIANALHDSRYGWKLGREYVTSKTAQRERQLAVLAVSLTVSFILSTPEAKAQSSSEEQKAIQSMTGEACAVLALLVTRSKDLQIAAVDARVIKPICSFLRKTFDSITLAKHMWSPRRRAGPDANAAESCRMGSNNLAPEIIHVMRCRKGALDALSALALTEDIHRQHVIEQNVFACYIDSLKPFSEDLIRDYNCSGTPITPKDGNTAPVLVAACNAARSLSRSVSVLRTTLVDAGIVKPLLQLLSHPSNRVKIAATDVFCNLVVEFSPMRNDLTDGTFVKIVAGHTRSASPELRLSSIWALMHLVKDCPRELKMAVFEELEGTWIVGTIRGEQRELSSGGGSSTGLSNSNAAGEQVDILNPSTIDVDNDERDSAFDIYGRGVHEEEGEGEELYDAASSTRYQASQMRSTLHTVSTAKSAQWLSVIRDHERNMEYQNGMHEVLMQAKTLDLLRNMMNCEDCSAICDYILRQIGMPEMWDLLTAKLLPLSRTSAGKLYQPPELVLSATHVIAHLANGGPDKRKMIASQKPLLQAMLPHFASNDTKIRLMMVWAVCSITWVQDDGDKAEAKERAQQLRAIGIEHAVQKLQDDKSLDVKERVKTALRQFEVVTR